MNGEHFLDTNVVIAWLVDHDHHSGKARPYFRRQAARHTSDFVLYEVRQVLGRIRKACGDLVANLEAARQTVVGTQNALLKAVRLTKGGLDDRDKSRVERLVQFFHRDIAAFQAGTLPAQDLLNRMVQPLTTGLQLLRTQTMCVVHRVPRDLPSIYGSVESALAGLIRNRSDIKVLLGAHHIRVSGTGLVPFITLDGTDFLGRASDISRIVAPLVPIAPDAWLARA